MENKLLKAIKEYSLIEDGDKIIVALSGGADSTALLCSLMSIRESLSLTIYACHINHLLRGDESFRDENFVRELCEKLGVELFVLHKKKNICGDVLQKAMTYAMAVLEVNASMGLIVAAPTAGSAGVVPGMMLALQECYRISDQRIVDALFNAGAVGYLAMRNATVAGAVGGCQAEVGIASAMAASAAVELMGGDPQQCLDAASTVLMNMLGLVCDPVGGLVEYPCQNRNAAGVANALIAAELSLSGIRQLIPFDQMLDAMYAVGKRLPAELRETALGGCAATPAACAACGLCSGN